MTPIQRRACLLLRGIQTGKFGPRRLIKALEARGLSDDWESIELSGRQLWRLARIHRKYRRQVGCADVLFWSQRLLAEQQFSTQQPAASRRQEDLCQQ
jgi:hypothetical protein